MALAITGRPISTPQFMTTSFVRRLTRHQGPQVTRPRYGSTNPFKLLLLHTTAAVATTYLLPSKRPVRCLLSPSVKRRTALDKTFILLLLLPAMAQTGCCIWQQDHESSPQHIIHYTTILQGVLPTPALGNTSCNISCWY